MIHSIKGTILSLKRYDSFFVLVVESSSGIGFNLKISSFTADACKSLGSEIKLFSYLVVRENAFELFGFFTESERNIFKLLISVSGVGPSFAISVLNKIGHVDLMSLIASGDEEALCCCKGVGKKTAGRIILELKSKIKKISFDCSGADVQNFKVKGMRDKNFEEAISALVVLGYDKSSAQKVVNSQSKSCSVEQLIKSALKVLS